MSWIKRDTANTIEEVVLRNTGYKKIKDLDSFLSKSYEIKYLSDAAQMIKDAVLSNQTITIVGDYDVDGVTSTTILNKIIEFLDGKATIRIPKRISEGYGLSEKIVDEIEDGLLITVDNGIVAFDAIQKAKEKGLSVIILDHHLIDDSGKIPCADIVIDPHIKGTADFEDYCAAGIAYRLAEIIVPNNRFLNQLSCFAALGTICDVMPLIEDNRRIVKIGLKNMVTYGQRTAGLYSILTCVDMDRIITEKDIGFKIGPMINAAGRLYDDGAKIAFDILNYDGDENLELGQKLAAINDDRKQLVQEGLTKIENNIRENCLFGDYPLVIYEPNIPEGIVGILAGRVAEERQTPTFIFTDSMEEGIFKGSARSYNGLHIKNLLDLCASKYKDLFYKYGGHEAAAGISVREEKFEDMCQALQENAEEPEKKIFKKDIYYDLEIDASEVTSTIEKLKTYAPYGEGNNRIVFKVNNFKLSPRYSSYYKTMGDKNQHIKLLGVEMSAIAFDMTQRYQDMGEPKKLDLIGTLSTFHYFKFSESQIEVDDMKKTKETTSKTTTLADLLRSKAKSRY